MAILSDEEVREELARRPAWRRSGDTLIRERALRDFAQALAFLERIGEAVEDYGRHPDIAITGGNRVRIMVSNANAAGITEAELRLVDKVDQVADAPAPQPKPRGALAAVVASAATAVEAVAPDPEPEPERARTSLDAAAAPHASSPGWAVSRSVPRRSSRRAGADRPPPRSLPCGRLDALRRVPRMRSSDLLRP